MTLVEEYMLLASNFRSLCKGEPKFKPTLEKAKLLQAMINMRKEMTPDQQAEISSRLQEPMCLRLDEAADAAFASRCFLYDGEYDEYARKESGSRHGPMFFLIQAMAISVHLARRMFPSGDPSLVDVNIAQKLVLYPISWFGPNADRECFDEKFLGRTEPRSWAVAHVADVIPQDPWVQSYKVDMRTVLDAPLFIYPTREPPLCKPNPFGKATHASAVDPVESPCPPAAFPFLKTLSPR